MRSVEVAIVREVYDFLSGVFLFFFCLNSAMGVLLLLLLLFLQSSG